jgi:NAD(P)-dependent dehydrogenase (short-subunit alcohol dehydrogenase family)
MSAKPEGRPASPRLAGETILITGSTKGLGRAMAETFAAEGARVAVSGRSESDGKEVVAGITDAGGQAMFVRLDVTDESSVRDAVTQSVQTFGKLTGLVNNAAWVQGRWKVDGPVTEISLENWEKILRVNLTGAFLASKYALPEIAKAGGGAVLNMSSVSAMRGRIGVDAYTASKGALVSLTRSMAYYYARYGIRVNCLVPGFIDTGQPSIKAMASDPVFGAQLMRHYLGKLGRPEDVALTAAHLMSHEAAFTTATIITVDGGDTGISHLDRDVPDMPGIKSNWQVNEAAAARLHEEVTGIPSDEQRSG